MESQDTSALLKNYTAAAGKTHSTTLSPSPIPDPVSLTDVQLKATAFQFKMREVANALQNAEPYLQILQQDKFFSQLYIDRESIGRLNTIAMNTNFDRFGVFFGLEDPETKAPLTDLKGAGFGRLTCCFVGLDENLEVLADHFPPTPARPYSVEAEDTWPPPPPPGINPQFTFNLSHDSNKVFAYFNAPASPIPVTQVSPAQSIPAPAKVVTASTQPAKIAEPLTN